VGRGDPRFLDGFVLGNLFAIFLIACLVGMSVVEIVRFRRAAADDQALPYPRRRLSRRLGAALLFIGLLTVALFWPGGASLGARSVLATGMLAALAVGLVLLVRDLHETSRSVVAMKAEMDRKTAEELVALMKGEGGEDAEEKKDQDQY
jgi:hypothetical protein